MPYLDMYQKVTFTLPKTTVKKLNKLAKKGERSALIAKLIEDEKTERRINKILNKKSLEEINKEVQRLKKGVQNLSVEEIIELKDRDRP